MGLAASQARLLTITSRKSDCEYQSMDLSHQKIALARDMSIVSAEYQDSLNRTKIVYDYYGTGDKSTQLSYDLLMYPSKLNNYAPAPVTDPSGRIVLDPGLAAAAKAAGIPQEGLGCTPSSDVRNRFIDGLMDNGVITRATGNGVKAVQYNANAGLGTTDLVTTSTERITFFDFIKDTLSNVELDLSDLTLDASGSHLKLIDHKTNTTYDKEEEIQGNAQSLDASRITVADLISNNHSYALYGTTWDTEDLAPYGGRNCIIDKVGSCSLWNELYATLAGVLPQDDELAQQALEYAKEQTLNSVVSLSNTQKLDYSNAAYKQRLIKKRTMGSWSLSQKDVENEAKNGSDKYVGYVYYVNNHEDNMSDYNDGYNMNLTNMAQAFYTYFAMYMEGLASTNYKVTREKATSEFVTDTFNASDFSFDIVSEADTSGDNLLISTFYDMLFNQIAVKGWVENDKVHENEYLATMLRNGSMYLSAIAEDDYYYQKNYSTMQYIKEITDEEYTAVAEAKYMREKEKINAKENILDMKMKNLDTEITALTTEYDTVKSVINNNIKTGFSRYKA